MKIPSRLKIGGRDYRVIFPYQFLDSPQLLDGLHDSDGQTIKLANIDSSGALRHDQAIAVTLWHEVLHAIDHIYLSDEIIKQAERGEVIISQLAEGIVQVLQDNKLLWREK